MKKTDLELLKGKKLDIRRSQEAGKGSAGRNPAGGSRPGKAPGGLMARLLGKAGVAEAGLGEAVDAKPAQDGSAPPGTPDV